LCSGWNIETASCWAKTATLTSDQAGREGEAALNSTIFAYFGYFGYFGHGLLIGQGQTKGLLIGQDRTKRN
jgi:hypothetical protein